MCIYVLCVCCYDLALWKDGLIFLNSFKQARVSVEYAVGCIWKCRLSQHLLFFPLPFRQKQSVQPIVCILPTTGNQYQPIYFHLPMPLQALAALSDKDRERERKKTWSTMAWAQHCSLWAQPASVVRIYFPHWDYCMCSAMHVLYDERLEVWPMWAWSGLTFRKLFLGSCTIIANMSYWKERSMLI